MTIFLTLFLSLIPIWQKQPNETCIEYGLRLDSLWSKHWCGDGPCYRSVNCPTRSCYSAAGFSLADYFKNQEHDCCTQDPIKWLSPEWRKGWRCNWGDPILKCTLPFGVDISGEIYNSHVSIISLTDLRIRDTKVTELGSLELQANECIVLGIGFSVSLGGTLRIK